MNSRVLYWSILITVALISIQAWCCSTPRNYVQPTNYELVKDSEAIVLAKAISFKRKGKFKDGRAEFGHFTFHVLEHIKGDFTNRTITIEGNTDYQSSGDQDDFASSRSGGGLCNAEDYKIGRQYILFLTHWKYLDRDEWIVSGPPFTRINIEVAGADAPWSKTVRHYSRIAAFKDYEKEKTALENLRLRAVRKDADCPAGLAQDIDLHFKRPTSGKSYADLKAIYDRAGTDGEIRETVLWSLGNGKLMEAKSMVEDLFLSGKWLDHVGAACFCAERLKITECRDILVKAIKEKTDNPWRTTMFHTLMSLSGKEQMPLMLDLLRSAKDDDMTGLSRWFVDHPSEEAKDYFRTLINGRYENEWELTLALAKMGDPAVIEWAANFRQTGKDRNWVAFYALAVSPLQEADALAVQTIKRRNQDDLVNLVQGYDESKVPQKMERLAMVVKTANRSRKLNFWLGRVLEPLAHSGDKAAESLLTKVPKVESEE